MGIGLKFRYNKMVKCGAAGREQEDLVWGRIQALPVGDRPDGRVIALRQGLCQPKCSRRSCAITFTHTTKTLPSEHGQIRALSFQPSSKTYFLTIFLSHTIVFTIHSVGQRKKNSGKFLVLLFICYYPYCPSTHKIYPKGIPFFLSPLLQLDYTK